MYLDGLDRALTVMAVGVAAAAGVGAYGAIRAYDQYFVNPANYRERAIDKLSQGDLSMIAMEKFAKRKGCDADRPYGADFVAKDLSGKVVEGYACVSYNREVKISYK